MRSSPPTPRTWRRSSSNPCSKAPGGCTCGARTRSTCSTVWRGEHGALVIHDEIATGFHRTGPLWAGSGRGDLVPDILCVGKALTGGYLSLAAVLCTREVAEGVSGGEAGALMHGPTFMGNPLACAVASANLDLLASRDTAAEVARIERGLRAGLERAASLDSVAEVRTLGAVGVVELREPVRVDGGDGRGNRAGGVAPAVPQPRLHDAALRHLRRRPGDRHPALWSGPWRTSTAERRVSPGGRAPTRHRASRSR